MIEHAYFRNSRNFVFARIFILLWIIPSCFALQGYGQAFSEENYQFRFDAGTSLQCPEDDKFIGSRPGLPEEPTRVGIGVFFLQIHQIDDVKETFDADVLYMRYWRDPRLAEPSRGDSYAFCRLPIDGFWIPEPEIENLRDLKEKRGGYLLIDGKGNVLLMQQLTLTIFNQMDSREFPFDRQILQLRLQPLFASAKEMILYPLKKYVQKAANLYVNGWKIEDLLVETGTDYALLRGTSFSTMQIRVPVFREKIFLFAN